MNDSQVGRRFAAFEVAIDSVRVHQIATALGVAETIFGDAETAAAAGLPAVAAIPVYFSNAIQLDVTGVNPLAEVASSRALLGGQEYWLGNGPVFVGEHLRGASTVTAESVLEARSGLLRRITIETTYARGDGSVALRALTHALDPVPS